MDYHVYNADVIHQIKQVPLLQSLKEEDIQELLKHSQIKEYNEGDLIVEEGSSGSKIYYLGWGKVKIVKNGVELLILQDAGNIFGEMAGIDGALRSASVYAMQNTMCLEIDISMIDNYLFSNQLELKYKIYRQFSEVMATRLRLTTNELIQTNKELALLKEEITKLKEELNALKRNSSK